MSRLPPSQWRSGRTTNAIERLHEEFKRRIKTQTVLPSADTAATLFPGRPFGLRIPIYSGRVFDAKPATFRRLAAFFLRVSDSGIRPPSIIGEEDLMPAKRELIMRQLRQMLRLHHDGVSAREIGRTLGVARSTIQDNLGRAQAAGIGWPLPGRVDRRDY